MPSFRDLPVDHIVDVRSKIEFWLGHLPGAVNIPLGDLPEGLDALVGVTRKSRVLVYCASGVRSAQAAAILGQAGYQRVTDGGGISEARRHFVSA